MIISSALEKRNQSELKRYYHDLTKLTDDKRQKIGIEIHSKQGRLKVIEQDKADITQQIEGLKMKLTNPEDDRLSIEQFLNLTVNQEKVLSCQLKPHFEEMIKRHQLRTGRGERN